MDYGTIPTRQEWGNTEINSYQRETVCSLNSNEYFNIFNILSGTKFISSV